MGTRIRFFAGFLTLALIVGCGFGGGSEVQRRHDELAQRVTKLEENLHNAQRQLIVQKQALQILSERMRTAEARVDKLAYGSSIRQ